MAGRRDEIVHVAGEILEREGPDGLTMRSIASEVGIQAPSLYKHVADKRDLEIALIGDGFLQQAEAFEKAISDEGEPIAAISSAYRRWALDHPHLYVLMNDQPLPRDELPAGVEGRSIAPVLEAFAGDRERARAAWAFAHGMVMLELADRFPADADLERTWAIGITSIAGLEDETQGAHRD